MEEEKQTPQQADYVPAQEPMALTEGARGRMSSLFTILALLLILFCATYLANAFMNRYLERVETKVVLQVYDGDGSQIQPNASKPPQSLDTMTIEPVEDADEEMTLQQIYKKAIQSVVSISAVSAHSGSSGSGVVLTEDGYLVTNYHVIDGAEEITVTLSDDRVLAADVVGTDEVTDLAVLRVQADDLVAAEFGDSSSLEVGDTVAAIGDPMGPELRGTMTNGIISGINRDIKIGGRTMSLLQTTAALNDGNSGGPLLNGKGQVIGINTMKLAGNDNEVEGIGFAIPSSIVESVVNEIMANGYVSGRPSLGLTFSSLSLAARVYYHLPNGLYISSVSENADAAEQGIQSGDILIAVNGETVSSSTDVENLISGSAVGDTATLSIFRGGWIYTVDVELIDTADA
jgi:serine protease Do